MTAQSQMTAQGQMKEKLLFLDDELLILTSLEHLFEDDYEVFTTIDAEAALAAGAGARHGGDPVR